MSVNKPAQRAFVHDQGNTWESFFVLEMSEEQGDIQLTEQTIDEARNQAAELGRAIDRLKAITDAKVNALQAEQLERLKSERSG